jgi:bla regulator protein BlaR1
MYALSQISSYLLAQSWQIAILITAVALVSFALRHRSAHIRYLLWLVVLAKCLVPPLLTVPLAVLPEKAILDLPTTSVIVPQASEAVAFEPVSPPTHFVQVPESNTTAAQKNRTLGQYLALGWMVGAVLYGLAALMQALWSTIWLRRRRLELSVDQHQQVEAIFTKLDIRSVPKIWLVPGMAQPFVWGLWRGSLYLPINFFQVKSTEHCRDILVHELCHVLRLDAAVNLLQAIAQAIFWFHPFVWWANQKIRMEREKCCDEMVVALLDAKVKEYSSAIVKALVTEHESAWPVPYLAVAGSAKDIEERIRTMM